MTRRNTLRYCALRRSLVANVEDWPFSSFHRDMRDYAACGRFEDFEKALAEYARKDRTSGYGER